MDVLLHVVDLLLAGTFEPQSALRDAFVVDALLTVQNLFLLGLGELLLFLCHEVADVLVPGGLGQGTLMLLHVRFLNEFGFALTLVLD